MPKEALFARTRYQLPWNGEQPYTVHVWRSLVVDALTNLVNGPPNITVTTTVCVGYAPGGCTSEGATVKAKVVDANGKVIKGVTVVGASGHIYN
jgi:hypothetical protein